MVESKDKIRNLFKAGLENYSVNPDHALWNKIVARRKSRVVALWRWTAAAAAILLMIGLGSLLILTNQKETTTTSIAVAESIYDKDTKHAISQDYESEGIGFEVTETVARTLQQSLPQLTQIRRQLVIPLDHILLIEASSIALNFTQPAFEDMDEVDETQAKDLAEYYAKLSIYLAEIEALADWHRMMNEARSRNNWDMAFAYGTTPQFSLPPGDQTLAPDKATYELDDFTSEIGRETSYYEEIDKTVHRHPLSFGLMGGLPLGKRWQIETGLVYTRLSSITKTIELSGWRSEYETGLHYVGIPLGLRFEFLQRRKFSLYLSQATLLEKGLRMSYTYTHFIDNEVFETETSFSEITGVQLSSLSSIGLDVMVSNNFSLYAQSGMQVFLLNEKQPFNIRSTRQFWPMVQTGLRYRFK